MTEEKANEAMTLFNTLIARVEIALELLSADEVSQEQVGKAKIELERGLKGE